MRYRTLALFAAIVASVIACFVMASPAQPTGTDNKLVLVVRRESGNKATTRTGVVVAIWDQGRIVVQTGESPEKEVFRVGQISPAALNTLLERLTAESKQGAERDHRVGYDEPCTTVVWQHGARWGSLAWTEDLSWTSVRPRGVEFDSFLRRWVSAKYLISSIVPVKTDEAELGEAAYKAIVEFVRDR